MKEVFFSTLPARERIQKFLPKHTPGVRKIIADKMMEGPKTALDLLLQNPQELDEEFKVVQRITAQAEGALNTCDLCVGLY